MSISISDGKHIDEYAVDYALIESRLVTISQKNLGLAPRVRGKQVNRLVEETAGSTTDSVRALAGVAR